MTSLKLQHSGGVGSGSGSRVARLAELPSAAEALGSGRLCWDHLRPLLRLIAAEAGDDPSELTERATAMSAAQLEAWARRVRVVEPVSEQEAYQRRSVRWWNEGDNVVRGSFRLPAADGAAVSAALDRLAKGDGPDPATGMYAPYHARCADALAELAGARLASDGDPDRACIVVHFECDVLAGLRSGAAEVDSEGLGGLGTLVNTDIGRRLACDARIQAVIEGLAGPVGVGRVQRTVPRWLYRLLRRRDHHCRFPGCDRTRFLHAHHIIHWADGGPTDHENLVLLCQAHHRLVHELGWHLSGNADLALTFTSPFGKTLRVGATAIHPELRRRLNRCFGTRRIPAP
ncbi:MAG: DUF222 domain-containing protein, partial [Acidimicrobiales bacterium]